MQVRDIFHRPVVTCEPETALKQAALLMSKNNVGSVVVVDKGHIEGIATDRDLVLRGVAEGLAPDAPIREVMSSDVLYVYEDEDVFTAATKMAEKGCRRLPVVDLAGRLTGMVSFDDLVAMFSDQVQRLAYTVRSEVGGRDVG